MVSVILECDAREKDELVAELWEQGTQGIAEDDLPDGHCQLRAFFDSVVDNPSWARFNPRWQEEQPADWTGKWRESWQPQLAGERFFLAPPWSDSPAPPGRIRLEMPAGMAFGTGQHPTTRLCIEQMERQIKQGETVLDVGTGSGILARAAVILKAGLVIGCDIESDAVSAAARYAEGASMFIGSLRSIRTASVDLLVANINAETILALAGEIRRTSRRAILSGFPSNDVSRIERLLGPSAGQHELDGWCALLWRNQ